MALTFLDTVNDEKLVRKIKEKLAPHFRGKMIQVYIIDEEENLEKIKQNKGFIQVIITKNCTPDFIEKALKITENVVYRFDEYERIENEIFNVLNKRNLEVKCEI